MFRVQDLDYIDFKIINLISEFGNLTVVAEKMFMTQPAISHRIRLIEQKLSIIVFRKFGHKFYLTNEGLELNAFYIKYRSLIRETNDKLNTIMNQVSGELTIGSSDTIALYILPQIIHEFRLKYPNVRLNLTSNPSRVVAKELLEGKIDLGIALTNALSNKFDILPLFTRQDVVIVASDNKLAKKKTLHLEDLINLDLVTLDESSQSRFFILDWFKKRSIPVKIGMELASIEMVKKYVELDYGFSIVPEFSVQNEIKEKRLVKLDISENVEYGTIALFTDKKRYKSTATHAFIDTVKAFDF